ncbi:MAG TPA: DNA-directed RNA polymerase subunit alpha C-terminal domain-containing protein [Pseudonocardiaceae bacterium]|nr:DNA-directed RNA polymerase subunit alpha C-terminal domain-containing protein [Pseudonocardiaceae bacterium]
MALQDETVRVRVEGDVPWLYAPDPPPVDASPEDALREALREFEDRPYSCYSATAWVPSGNGSGGRTLVFRRPGRVVHVIGTGKLAECFRELLRGGVAGWTLHPMPATQTPLEVAEPTLGHRAYKLLAREGFTSLEDLAAVPDEALMRLRNLGPKSLDAIHQALAAYSEATVAHPSEADTHAERREHIDTALSPAHRVRNAQLLELLVRSSVPLEAIDAILASLEAEPVPPVDPMVTLLLKTAREPELVALYERAHQPGPEPGNLQE